MRTAMPKAMRVRADEILLVALFGANIIAIAAALNGAL